MYLTVPDNWRGKNSPRLQRPSGRAWPTDVVRHLEPLVLAVQFQSELVRRHIRRAPLDKSPQIIHEQAWLTLNGVLVERIRALGTAEPNALLGDQSSGFRHYPLHGGDTNESPSLRMWIDDMVQSSPALAIQVLRSIVSSTFEIRYRFHEITSVASAGVISQALRTHYGEALTNKEYDGSDWQDL